MISVRHSGREGEVGERVRPIHENKPPDAGGFWDRCKTQEVSGGIRSPATQTDVSAAPLISLHVVNLLSWKRRGLSRTYYVVFPRCLGVKVNACTGGQKADQEVFTVIRRLQMPFTAYSRYQLFPA